MIEMKSSKPGRATVQVLNFPTAGSKGRNGPFTARSLTIRAVPAIELEQAAMVTVDAHSQRAGAPLRLSLSPADALILAEELVRAAQSAIPASVLTAAQEAADVPRTK